MGTAPTEEQPLVDKGRSQMVEEPPNRLASSVDTEASAMANFLKWGSLALVIVQNSSHVLLLRYSRVAGGDCAGYIVSLPSFYRLTPTFILLQYKHMNLTQNMIQ